jgi:hypothetical protein
MTQSLLGAGLRPRDLADQQRSTTRGIFPPLMHRRVRARIQRSGQPDRHRVQADLRKATNRRRTTQSADRPFAASGSNHTRTSRWLSMTVKPHTLVAKHSESAGTKP